MTTEYSIQKMVSDGTLSTIALGIQYLQRNDIYMRIAGEETPQSGAPSGYTWYFLDNTTLKILPVVPNGVEVVVYRRTDVAAMYNIYSQNAQFDESTIDENNQQLLYIAQEYFEQGVPAQLIDSVEYVREDTTNMYYHLKLSDGKYTAEFPIPKGGAAGFEALRRTYADAGLRLVDGSFETGGTLSSGTDVLLHNATAKAYSWSGVFPKVVPPSSTPYSTGGIAVGAWISRFDSDLREYVLNITTATFKNDGVHSAVDNMVAGRINGGAGAVTHIVGNIYSTGNTTWKCLVNGVATIGDFAPLSHVNVRDFGAVGDGVTNDTAAIQSAIDILTSGGVVIFPPGIYMVERNIGVNDRWGLNVSNSNIELKGESAFIKRFDADISTFALAYPLLFVGVPDNDTVPLTKGVKITNIGFIGNDTRHSSSGDNLHDFRCAIELKNTSDTLISGCTFDNIDSGAIYYQQPAAYNYAGGVYYNKTKNYKSRVNGCVFKAVPHTVQNRALIHAISVGGVDGLVVSGNSFEWCDDCVAGEGTYNRFTDKENDTFTPTGGAAILGSLRRSGRNIVISTNNIVNSSEHALYLSVMGVVATGNTISTDTPSICSGDQIKIRGRGVTCSSNVISGFPTGISINEPSLDVSVTGNTIISTGISGAGAIDVNSNGLSSYISARGFMFVSGSPDYQQMGNFTISGNSVTFPTTAAPNAESHIFFRVYTDISDANYPNGQIAAINVSGNSIQNYNVGFLIYNSLFNSMSLVGNTLQAKPFTRAGFGAGTTLGTRAVIQCGSLGSPSSMEGISFHGNTVTGASYLIATTTGSGTTLSMLAPRGMTGNRFDYVKNIKTPDIQNFSFGNRFAENTGLFFLDRSISGSSIGNSLNDGVSSNTEKKYCFQWTGAELRFYKDDVGGFNVL